MTKYKIHIDKPLPDPKHIARHKDFDSLYHQYQVNTRFEFWRDLYRKPRYFAGLVAVIAILFLVIDSPEDSSRPPLMMPPIEAIDIPFVSQEMSADDPNNLKIGDNWELVIPAEAFIDPATEQIVSGPIQLEVREFFDPADLFMAGISMTDDSMNQGEGLESLTLLQVEARQDGRLIALRKSLEAIYYTEDTSQNYLVYHLDTISRSWIDRGKDDMEWVVLPPDSSRILPRPSRPELLALNDQQGDQMIPRAAKPIPQKPGKPFGVKVKNLEDYPEFRGFEKVYWEYVAMSGSVNPWTEGLIGEGKGWEDVRIKRMPTRPDGFELTFAKQTDAGGLLFRKVIAKPMFEARTQAEADRIYQERFRAYQTAVAERQQDIQETLDLRSQIAQAEQAYADSLTAWEASKLDSTYATYRKFSFDQLGVIGLNRKQTLSTQQTAVQLQLEGEPLTAGSEQTVYMILPEKHTVIHGYLTEDTLRIPAHQQVYLLTKDPESGQLLIGELSPDQNAPSAEAIIVPCSPFKQVDNEEHMRELLKIHLLGEPRKDPSVL